MKESLYSKRGVRSFAFRFIGPLNYLLLKWCSFFRPVLVGKKWSDVMGGAGFWIPKWVANYDLHSTITNNLKCRFHEVGWRFLRRKIGLSSEQQMPYSNAGVEIDYSPLLLKALAEEVFILVEIKWAAKRLGLVPVRYFGHILSPLTERSRAWSFGLTGLVHCFLAWLMELRTSISFLGLQLFRVMRAICSKRRNYNGENTIWFGVGTNEYGKFGEGRCFYWPERIKSELKILYVLPRIPNEALQQELARTNVRWVSQWDVLRYCSKQQLILLMSKLLWASMCLFVPWRGSFLLRARMSGYHVEALSWIEFAKAVPIKLALTTAGMWNSTRSYLIALKKCGVKTAIWNYSANTIGFQHPGARKLQSKRMYRPPHEAERIYVWNKHIGRWYSDNCFYDSQTKIVVVGPVMCGDASICIQDVQPSRDKIRVSVFDVSLLSAKLRKIRGGTLMSTEHQDAFWRDMKRLVLDLPDIALVLKPKKSPSSNPMFVFPECFHELLNDEELRVKGRIEVIADDAEPYRALSRSQIAIGMPFTSPSLAAWHFGKAGVYYDSVGLVGLHEYTGLGRLFCRSYGELFSTISEMVDTLKIKGEIEPPDQVLEFIGRQWRDDPQKVLIHELESWVMGSEDDPQIRASESSLQKMGAA